MRIPKRGPLLQTLLSKPGAVETLSKASREIRELLAQANEQAWNWEDCSHRSHLVGLSPEEFWTHVRLSRTTNRFVPIKDRNGDEFSFWWPHAADRILHLIDLHLGGSIGSTFPQLTSEEQQKRFMITSLREEAISSSLIEGAVVTRNEAREMIRTQRAPASKHERMVLNNYRTIQMLNRRRHEPMTIDLLCEVQNMLTEGTLNEEGEGGRFRRTDEPVTVHDEETNETIYTPPPADELPRRMATFCEFANQTADSEPFLHPAIRSIILHFWVGFDHPFVDGNGRTARAVFYWSMLKSGYWLTEFLSISTIIHQHPKQYYRAFLNSEIDDNDLTYFILYHLRVIERSIKEFRDYLDRKRAEMQALAPLLAGSFNERQQAILQRAIEDPGSRFTYTSHSESHGVTLATARTDLLDLERRRLLVGNRKGRAFEFVPALELESRLNKIAKKKC